MMIKDLQTQLKLKANNQVKHSAQRWFKQPIRCYGIRTPHVRMIAKNTYPKVKYLKKQELFALCEQLMKSGYQEEFIIASAWIFKRRTEFTASDFYVFKHWIEKYCSNWAKCDDFCTKSLGHLLLDYPSLVSNIKSSTASKNTWVLRACAVSMIIPARHKRNLDDIFEIALALLEHPEDMVQKGYGWMLKEASKHYEQNVFDFVLKHKHRMPRTALRYAIEHMPKKHKQRAMAKEKHPNA